MKATGMIKPRGQGLYKLLIFHTSVRAYVPRQWWGL